MGNEVSYSRTSSTSYDYQSLQPISMPRTGKEKSTNTPEIYNNSSSLVGSSLLKTAFTCLWSIRTPGGTSPLPRTGHFFAFNATTRIVYIGYGISSMGTVLSDFWAFHIDKSCWEKIELQGDVPSPRSGVSACFVHDSLVIFGGSNNNTLYNDLYVVDVSNHNSKQITTSGFQPAARSDAYIGYYNNKLVLFGGFKSSIYSDMYILDINNYTWREIDINISWNCQAPHCQSEECIYSYGGDKGSNLLKINIDEETATISPCIGATPVHDPIHGTLVYCSGYLVCFGGKTKNDLTLVYALDLETNWWFVLYVAPDQETTTFSDGAISNGVFLMPAFHSFSSFYDPVTRCIISFLGVPFIDPPTISVINVGQSFPIINLRKDMICMYHCK